MKKTVKELEAELLLKDSLKTERDISNTTYALKWTERFLIWAGTLIGLAIIAAFMRLVLK